MFKGVCYLKGKANITSMDNLPSFLLFSVLIMS